MNVFCCAVLITGFCADPEIDGAFRGPAVAHDSPNRHAAAAAATARFWEIVKQVTDSKAYRRPKIAFRLGRLTTSHIVKYSK